MYDINIQIRSADGRRQQETREEEGGGRERGVKKEGRNSGEGRG